MVNEDIFKDLLSYNIPIIAVGDHVQLAPIEGMFNLMEKPQLRLENIHRQEENNPIMNYLLWLEVVVLFLHINLLTMLLSLINLTQNLGK